MGKEVCLNCYHYPICEVNLRLRKINRQYARRFGKGISAEQMMDILTREASSYDYYEPILYPKRVKQVQNGK